MHPLSVKCHAVAFISQHSRRGPLWQSHSAAARLCGRGQGCAFPIPHTAAAGSLSASCIQPLQQTAIPIRIGWLPEACNASV